MNRKNRRLDNFTSAAVAFALLLFANRLLAFDPWFAVEEAKLVSSTPQYAATLAWSGVAVSGDTVVAGADNDAGPFFPNQGAAYVFVRDGLNWTQQAKVTGSGPSPSMSFGSDVAIDGDVMVVGAPYANGPNANGQGAAYVFVRSGTTWTERARLTAADAAADDLFGAGVAISGTTIVVGAWGDDVAANPGAGSAYVFEYNGTTWVQEAKLTASDAAANDNFGGSVAIGTDTIVCSATGKDSFTIPNYGAAYVFVRNAGVWTQQAILTAPVLRPDSYFGFPAAISGDTIAVGASNENGNYTEEGAAYVFTRTGTAWNFQAELHSPSPDPYAHFGISVDLDGDTLAIGARDDGGPVLPGQGGSYVYKRTAGAWNFAVAPSASDPQDGAYYGNSIAVENNRLYVGAGRWNGPTANIQGAVYTYRLSPMNCCKGDMNANGAVDPVDVSLFVQVLLNGLVDADLVCAADMNNDFAVNGLDTQAFINKILTGGACP